MNRTAGIVTDLCRLCMKNNDYYYNIFTSNVACRVTVKDAMHGLLGLEVAVGDGLPSNLCPVCLNKLTEFSVFKKICLESDANLRKFCGSNYFRSIQGDEVADDELGSPADTKDFIQDEIQGTSRPTCSVQMTEIYIPVPHSQQPGANILFNLKEESEDPLSEGNYSLMHTTDPALISTDASDPLATDDWPTDKGNGGLVQNGTMAMESMTEAVDKFSSGGACNCGCKENKRLIDVLLKRVETTNVLLLETTQSLIAAVNNLKERPSHFQGVPDVELNFPLRTVEDYEVMENDLKDVAFRELVKGVLKIQGGASLVTAVNGILYYAMTDALGKCFTYKGVPARNKFSFKDSRLDKLIFEVIQGRPSLANHSRKEVGKAVAEWLRQAGARDRRKQAKDAQPRLESL
ncbi:uncharacterized protein LOC124173324 isoform X1 [Ischnura elegans]|uniref:uncharacterized protein LOC124173324 isoform X1 n=1 Tax=Ischnura elegans TaxID=197161 RepID=UPI001ED88B9A|nr:uncharacterized protein LOC124173324 isoform X1 [Ischnura elegans]XP_046408810.1 uncharacterized protein LOC124173324 isoform X1 [Ischnura elegans]